MEAGSQVTDRISEKARCFERLAFSLVEEREQRSQYAQRIVGAQLSYG